MRTVGRYEVLRELGRGGTAMVYLARHADLDRLVALKELASLDGSDPSSSLRFLRESRLSSSLSHPNVVHVHDYFEHEGTPYIAMEYLSHGSLRPHVGRLTLPQIVGVLEGLLAGLGAAEALGIVHRDLKPENLMVTARGQVKIADFGIAKATSEGQANGFMTAAGMTVGTPVYMAPEQAKGQQIGPWTDLYSVGCIAFELLVGRAPFDPSEAPMTILLRQLNDPIPAVRTIDPEIDQGISDWVERLVRKDPDARTRSSLEAWDELEEIVIGLLGPRWRREARLAGDASAGEGQPQPLTPAPFAPVTDSGEYEEFAWADADEPGQAAMEAAPDTPPPGPADAAPDTPPPMPAAIETGEFGAPAPSMPTEALLSVPAPPAPPPPAAPPEPEPMAEPPEPPPMAEPTVPPPAIGPPVGAAAGAAAARRGLGRFLGGVAGMLHGRDREPEDARDAPVEDARDAPVEDSAPFRRTPHLDLEPPPPLRPGNVFEVVVFADRAPARIGEEVEPIALSAPAEAGSFDLAVWLVTSHHFVVSDAPIKTITLRRGEDRCEPARFRVAVAAAPAAGEEPLITASFSYGGRPSGRVTRLVQIEAEQTASAAAAAARPITATHSALEVDTRAAAPDLVVEIASPELDERRFEVRVDTPLLDLERRTETWFLPQETAALVEAAMRSFFEPQASRAARIASLRGAGLELFEAAPVLFQEVYWRLHDSGREPHTLLIASDERSIPWELMIPSRRTAGGERETHEPLGVKLAIGRWHRATGVSPRQKVPLRTSYVVAPRYQGSAHLELAAEEAEFVCRHFDGRRIDPARFDHLEDVLADGGADLLHFVCHGEADADGSPVLRLEDPDLLDARQVRAMPGLQRACRERKPFVFLNACDVGRPARGLIGASGFAKSFIDIEASCLVGTLWSVDDRTAHAVAVAFYEQILQEPETPFAEGLRRIRARAYEEGGEDTYAAYCFYGDPAASTA